MFFARARQALVTGVRALGLLAGDEVIVPAYHHGSEVEALVAAGLVPRFYEATGDLVPDEAEIDSLLGPRTRALQVTHYLGFPQDLRPWRRWCDERGLLLIEDAAQSWLAHVDGRPVGTLGDLAIVCLYKTYGLPDGAALVVPSMPVVPPLPVGPAGVGLLVHRHAAWAAARWPVVADLLTRLARPEEYSCTRDFDLGDVTAPCRATLFLLPRLGDEAAVRRRANYSMLLQELGENVPAPFRVVQPGCSPFMFPLSVGNKGQVLDHLRRAKIQPLDFWSSPHPRLQVADFPGAARRRAETIGLPVHQELSEDAVLRIVREVRASPLTPTVRTP